MGRDLEWLIGPVQGGAGVGDLVGAERRAVRLFAALPVRCTESDRGAAGNQRWPVVAARAIDRRGDLFGIVPIDPASRPARGLEPHELVVRAGQRGRSVDRDLVVVEQDNQPLQPEMPGQRNRLVAQALHQAAITGDDIGVVIHEIITEARIQQPFGQRHADRRRNALAERPSGGLDPRRVAIFGMPRRVRSPLPECPELVQCHGLIAGQVQQRVEQHRTVARGQHKTVAIRPERVGRIEFEEAREQHRGDVGHAHRHPRMTRFRVFNVIDREKADRIGHIRMRHIRTVARCQCMNGHIVRLLRSISCRIRGVRMSCIARSSLAPWITIELARDMKLLGIIDSK